MEIQSIEESVEKVKDSIDTSIDNVRKELLELKEETNTLKQNEDYDDLVELKKSYNQYVKKVDNAIEKLGKTIFAMQEKNTEGNKNLQVRIKKYIDNKNITTINQMNDIINKFGLSFKEREKIRQEEFEQLLNKKIKEIQKENEKLIKRQVEELNSSLLKNESYSANNSNLSANYNSDTKKSKKMYDFFDNSNYLMQSASSNKKIGSTKDEEPNILKFFFDDDEDI